MKKLKHALLVVFSMALMLCLAFGAAACVDTTDPNGSETVTYTVTVTCEDQTGTANAKVQIKKDGANVGEAKALTDGKASFDLETGTYTATLTGVAEGYIFEDVTLTAENPSATIAVTKEEVPGPALSTYTVTVLCDDPEAILNAKVQIQKDGANVGEAKALTGGKASFELEAGDYTATLVDVAEGYTFDPVTMSATKTTAIINVTPETPLGPTLVTYTVNVSCEDESALVNARVVLKKDGVEADSKGIVNGKAIFSLEAGDYTVEITGLASGYEYTAQTLSESVTEVTIEVTKRAVEDNKGTGTAGDPYIIETLVGEYDATVKYVDGEFQSVYFQYTAKEDGEYTVSSEDESNYSISFTGAKAVQGQVIPTAHAGVPADIAVTKDTVLTIRVQEFDDTVTKEFTVHFVIKPYEAPAPAEGSSRETAVEIKEFVGSHSHDVPPAFYFKYASAKEQTYTVTATSSYGLYMSVYDAADPTSKAIAHVEIMTKDGTGNVTLEADKTYVFGVSPGVDGEWSSAVTVTFTVAETVVSAEPDGSEANPYPLGTPFVGRHDLTLKNTEGEYYYFYAEEDGSYIFTANTAIYLKITGVSGDALSGAAGKVQARTYQLKAETKYVFRVMAYGPNGSPEVSFSVEKKEEISVDPNKGTKEKPEVLEKLEGTYERVVSAALASPDGYYMTYTPTENGTYTFAVTKASNAVSLSVNGSPVGTLNAGAAAKSFDVTAGTAITLRLYLNPGQTPEKVTFVFAKSNGQETPVEQGTSSNPEVLETLEGTYKKSLTATKGYYWKYTPTEEASYTITLVTENITVYFQIGSEYFDLSTAGKGETGPSATFTLKPGAAVTIRVYNYVGEVEFTIAKAAEPEPEPTPDPDSPWAGGKGTALDPYIMKEFVGTYKMPLGSMEMPNGLKYTVTESDAGKYTVTLITANIPMMSNIEIRVNESTSYYIGYDDEDLVTKVDIEVKAGDVVVFYLMGSSAAEVEFTVAKAAN